MATPFPIVSTKNYPSILFYAQPRLGRYYNLLTHFVFDKVFWALAKSPLKEYWTKNIKTKVDFKTSPIKQQIGNGQLVLNGYSQYLFAQPRQWPSNIHTTGSWIVDTEPNFVPSTELNDFIANGEPPIYIGFGSMKDTDGLSKTLTLIIDALEVTKQRAVVGLGWTKNDYSKPLPANIFLIENVPHTWLFPKIKMVIHHGGAGTTATGLAAGKPTIIIPHNADQPAWGQRVFELGVGSKPIKKAGLTAEKLANAILFSQKPDIVANAERLGKQMRTEHGVQNAVKIIDQFLKSED